ncbi:MAG: ATP-binding cassette domain-containing protein, partial [Bacteroidales bacterium]|nr:ATP-binding cassette domain-containing protein [Bacteroidales bacterium]
MIRVENVSKYFGERQVLKNINTEFETGKCNLIIGKSGSGKTVLMKCLVSLYTPDEGFIHFDDRVLRHLNKKEKVNLRKDIGMLFQGGALFDSMNIEENVMFPIRMFQLSDYKTMKKRVDFCLDRVNL